MILFPEVTQKAVILKPMVVCISAIMLTACASTSSKAPKTGVSSANSSAGITRTQQALLDVNSTDELADLLAAHNMDMVENDQADILRMGNLWDRLRRGFRLNHNMAFNPRIEAQRSWFVTRQTYLDRLTARASRYLYHTIREAEKRHIPTELALLPVIESSYDPSATSNAAAAGMWQFIPSTGKMYGLQITSDYDGRRDVIESTRAAYDFLTDLYNQFGSWELALASYNAGPGRVQKAIDRNQSLGLPTDFWSLKLPEETMNYVPRFLAVADIVANPSVYGVRLPAIANKQHFRTVPVGSGTSLYQVAQVTGVSSSELQALNTGLVYGQVSGWSPQRVLIPHSVDTNLDSKITNLSTASPLTTTVGLVANEAVTFTPSTATSLNTNVPIYNSQPYDNSKLPTSATELAQFAQNSQIANAANTINTASVGASALTTSYSEPPLSAAETQAISDSVVVEPALTETELQALLPEKEPPLNEQELQVISEQLIKEQVAGAQKGLVVSSDVEQNLSDAKSSTVQLLPQADVVMTELPTDPLPDIDPIQVNNKVEVDKVELANIETQQTVLEEQGVTKKLSFATSDNPQNDSTSKDSNLSESNQPSGKRSTYTVQKGDTLLNIAKRAEVNWRDIATWNQMEADATLLAGATLYLYDAKSIKPLETAKSTSQDKSASEQSSNKQNSQASKRPESYVVRSGDTLIGTAAEFGLSASQLAKYNGLAVTDNLLIGQKLWLIDGKIKPTTTNAKTNANKPVSSGTANTPKTQNYKVQAGDGLIALSRRFDVPVQTLAGLNGLSATDNLLVGQNILIPVAKGAQSSSTSSKPSANSTGANKSDTTSISSYKVKSGDTLSGIASKLGVTNADIAAVNNFDSRYRVQLGQTIKVPVDTSVVALKLNNQPQKYKVQSGDTLLGVAGRFGVPASALAKANDLTVTSNLLKGSTLSIPAKGQTVTSQAPQTTQTTQNSKAADSSVNIPQTYVVESGDSLLGLANRFHTTLSKLASLNDIAVDGGIRIGQKLKIPQPVK